MNEILCFLTSKCTLELDLILASLMNLIKECFPRVILFLGLFVLLPPRVLNFSFDDRLELIILAFLLFLVYTFSRRTYLDFIVLDDKFKKLPNKFKAIPL